MVIEAKFLLILINLDPNLCAVFLDGRQVSGREPKTSTMLFTLTRACLFNSLYGISSLNYLNVPVFRKSYEKRRLAKSLATAAVYF